MTPLDRPVWSSLTTAHFDLSEGDDMARRYAKDVNLFASARDDDPAALERLSSLIGPGEQAFILQVPPIAMPPRLKVQNEAWGVQMVDSGAELPGEENGDIVALEDEDAAEMLALATLTKPGPFVARTHVMGDFFGIRVDGRLVAMAGERMRFPGYTEVSGVCTHPDFRGRGYGRRLSAHVTASIRSRGEIPFLHSWKTNGVAIGMYEDLGFKHRCDVHVTVLANEPVF
jgi:predicted GNAT family acetyltransferase